MDYQILLTNYPIFKYLPYILGISGLLYIFIAINSIKNYKKRHTKLVELESRCILCEAEIVNPVIIKSYSKELIIDAVEIISHFIGVPVYFINSSETVYAEVKYKVNEQEIKNVIPRRAAIYHPKQGYSIAIYYDPLNPKMAFAKDMEDIIFKKPLRDCVFNIIIAAILIFSCIFTALNVMV